MKKIILFVAIFVITIMSAGAQGIVGTWTGVLKVGGMALRLNFKAEATGDGFVGWMQSPDQSAEWAAADAVTVADGEVAFTVGKWAAAYKGKLDGETVRGEFMQMGASLPLDLVRVGTAADREVSAQDFVGNWTGVIGDMGLAQNFEITAVDGGVTGRVQSPYQSPQWFEADEVAVDGGRLVLSRNTGVYKGRFDGESIDGVITQNGKSHTLRLVRGEVRRPQLPADQPYNAEDVVFANGDVVLAGTLTMPVEGARRAMVLISGSGPQNRDEELMGHRPFLVLADYLTRRGIAVLRYDDRGTAQSGGDFNASDLYDFAGDARAAVEFLRGRGFSEVGVAGHSEGGMAALILAAEGVPDFAVTMAGPGVDGATLLDSQRAAISRAAGADEGYIAEYNKAMNAAMDIIFAGGERAAVLAELKELFAGTPLAGYEEVTLAQMDMPGMRSFILFDPAGYYPKITIPVLAVNGGKDLQVPGRENLDAIKIGIPNATIGLYPELNHLFQTAPTGAIAEYGQIEETFNEQVMADIAGWISGLDN